MPMSRIGDGDGGGADGEERERAKQNTLNAETAEAAEPKCLKTLGVLCELCVQTSIFFAGSELRLHHWPLRRAVGARGWIQGNERGWRS